MHDASLTDSGETTGIPSGKVGMWWFLASETMVFGGLISCYILLRLASEGWKETAADVSLKLASFNTLMLLTSSLTMMLAFDAVKRRDLRNVCVFLLLTVLLGLGFLGIKGFAYAIELTHGFTPLSGLFWSFYYARTGLHGLHVLSGVIVNLVLLLMALGKPPWLKLLSRVEYAGLYWHFVDVIWIFFYAHLHDITRAGERL